MFSFQKACISDTFVKYLKSRHSSWDFSHLMYLKTENTKSLFLFFTFIWTIFWWSLFSYSIQLYLCTLYCNSRVLMNALSDFSASSSPLQLAIVPPFLVLGIWSGQSLSTKCFYGMPAINGWYRSFKLQTLNLGQLPWSSRFHRKLRLLDSMHSYSTTSRPKKNKK